MLALYELGLDWGDVALMQADLISAIHRNNLKLLRQWSRK